MKIWCLVAILKLTRSCKAEQLCSCSYFSCNRSKIGWPFMAYNWYGVHLHAIQWERWENIFYSQTVVMKIQWPSLAATLDIIYTCTYRKFLLCLKRVIDINELVKMQINISHSCLFANTCQAFSRSNLWDFTCQKLNCVGKSKEFCLDDFLLMFKSWLVVTFKGCEN